jgi:hypothetical protein
MVDLGQKRRKRFRLFYWNKVSKKNQEKRIKKSIEQKK